MITHRVLLLNVEWGRVRRVGATWPKRGLNKGKNYED